MKHLLLPILSLLFTLSASCEQAAPQLELEVKVVDDEGKLVEGAIVRMAGNIGVKSDPGGGFGTTVYSEDEKETDENGKAKLHIGFFNHYGISAKKEGYYQSSGKEPDVKQVGLKWVPDESSTTIVLKRKKNPIPMHVKKFEGYIPIKKKPIGFDFIIGDWVAPYGKGVRSDMIFIYSGEVINFKEFNGELVLNTENPLDGIRETPKDNSGSRYKGPYEVKKGKWENTFKWKRSRGIVNGKTKMVDTYKEDRIWNIRFRSSVSADRKTTKAHFGKLFGDIKFDPRTEKGAAHIVFTYYANPTLNDRNIEFDPKRNLFKDADRSFDP